MQRELTNGVIIVLTALFLAGCTYPRDPEGTTGRVAETGTIRAGLVDEQRNAEPIQALAEQIAAAADADLAVSRASAEQLLVRLENGELDFVVGTFAANSPWGERVMLSAEPHDIPASAPVVRVAVRNGENGWMMQLEQALASSGP